MNDDKLISGEFFDVSLPKEKQYLYKYFRTPLQQQFVRYVYVMGETPEVAYHFTEHTGYRVVQRVAFGLLAKYKLIEDLWRQAKKNLDFELLKTIEDGKFKTGSHF